MIFVRELFKKRMCNPYQDMIHFKRIGEGSPFFRSLFKSMGYSDYELDHKPLIGISNTWTCLGSGKRQIRDAFPLIM